MNNNAPLERAMRMLVVGVVLTLAVLVCFGRIYLQYHSWSQVIIGALIGIFTGSTWFTLTHLFLAPKFPWVVSWLVKLHSIIKAFVHTYNTKENVC